MAFLLTFSTQLFKPFLAATPLGAVEQLQMTISPRQLFSRVFCLSAQWRIALTHLTFRRAIIELRGSSQTMNSPAATSSDSVATDTSCCQSHLQWPSLAVTVLGSAPAANLHPWPSPRLKPNSRSHGENPIQLQRHFSVALMASRP